MRKFFFSVSVTILLAGCSSAYYSGMETLGIHKRDILVDRIDDAADSQEQAKEQFKDALEQFGSIVNYDGGDLQKTYDQLNAEYQSSLDRANDVTSRINSVEAVSEDLFEEWEDELDSYTSQDLRKKKSISINANPPSIFRSDCLHAFRRRKNAAGT